MSQDTASTPVLLTDLCAICHVNPIKYTCPRDGTHTCSLPCVKRHKQWAQCSGIRDPAEYRKRSELETPASVDKDFNFITSVERSLTRADDNVADRGIDLHPARLSRPKDARPKFEIEAEIRGVKIIKAPKGLSRSKENKTSWSGQPKCIVWTVEWLCQDGRRLINLNPETKPLKELFSAAAGSKRHHRKRKRPSDATDTQPKIKLQETDESISTTSVKDPAPDSDPLNQYFYLHRPLTESRLKCLIPISASDSLQEVLINKTLLEFPTIHVRNESPEHLSKPFVTEGDYNSQHGTSIPITLSIPEANTLEDDLEEGELVETDDILNNLDEAKVLEVLRKDLAG